MEAYINVCIYICVRPVVKIIKVLFDLFPEGEGRWASQGKWPTGCAAHKSVFRAVYKVHCKGQVFTYMHMTQMIQYC